MQTMAVIRGGMMNALVRSWTRLRPDLPSRGVLQPRHVRHRSLSTTAFAAPAKKQAEALVYKKLGDSDLVISEITLGTMTWGHQTTEKEAHEQLAYAFDAGINILDTSEVFPVPMREETAGSTDRIIAGWLKTVPRDKVVVATKVVGCSERVAYLRDNLSTTRVDRKNVKESVEKSLKRLGVDHIDLLQIHWPDRYAPIFGEYFYEPSRFRESKPFEEQLEAFQEVIQEGKVRYIGVSNETSFGVMSFLHAAKTMGLPKVVSIQNSFSLLVRCHFQVDLVEVCTPENGNIGLLAYSPLAGGTLSGKYKDPNSDAAKKGRLHLFPGFMDRYSQALAKDAVEAFSQVAKRHNITLPQLSLAFCRNRPFVTSTIIGATSMDQLKENISAFQLARPLSTEIVDDIEAVFNKYRDPTII